MQVPCLVLLEILALRALVPLLQYGLQRLGNDLCHAPDPYISETILLRALLTKLFYLASNFTSQGKDFAIMHGSVEPPDLYPASVFHVVSSRSRRLLSELLSSIAIAQTLGVVEAKPRTTHGVVHLLNSC